MDASNNPIRIFIDLDKNSDNSISSTYQQKDNVLKLKGKICLPFISVRFITVGNSSDADLAGLVILAGG